VLVKKKTSATFNTQNQLKTATLRLLSLGLLVRVLVLLLMTAAETIANTPLPNAKSKPKIGFTLTF
jgi:hypothetical protein